MAPGSLNYLKDGLVVSSYLLRGSDFSCAVTETYICYSITSCLKSSVKFYAFWLAASGLEYAFLTGMDLEFLLIRLCLR